MSSQIAISGKRQLPGYSYLQAVLLILATLAVCVLAGYGIGKYFFWTTMDLKRVEGQLQYYEQKVKANPQDLEGRLNLGYTYFLKGDNENAIKEFNQILDQNKKHYGAHYNLGLVYIKEERYNDAILALQKAAEILPKDYKAYVQMGIAERGMKEYKKAFEKLIKANELMPKSSDIIYQMGLTSEVQGDTKTAIDLYKEALKYDPLYKDASKALEKLQKK